MLFCKKSKLRKISFLEFNQKVLNDIDNISNLVLELSIIN